MVSWRRIQRTFENCLITVKCKRWPDGSHPVFLLGLAELKKRVEGTEGWLLIVSGDPLVAHGVDEYLPNKINIGRLHVTYEQKSLVTEASTIPDGNVYLYAGNFFVRKCAMSSPEEECKHESLDVLKLLCDLMLYNLVELEPLLVVPYKIKNLSRIYKPRCLKGKNMHCRKRQDCHHYDEENSGQNPPPPPTPVDEEQKLKWTMAEESGQGVFFVFRRVGPQAVLEFECSADHSGYRVEVCLMETFVCEENVTDSWGRGRITRVLEQDVVYVPPSFMAYQPREVSYIGNGRVLVPLKIYQPPNYDDNPRQREVLDKYRVASVEHWGIARILLGIDDVGDGECMDNLERYHVGKGNRSGKKKIEGFVTTAVTASSTLFPRYYYCYPNSHAPPSLSSPVRVPVQGSSKEKKRAACAIPVRMVLYKMMLSP